MKRYVSILLVCFLISGCAKQEIIDRIKIVQSVGFDVQGDIFKSSGTYASYQKKELLRLMNVEAQTFGGVWLPQNTKSDDQIVTGQIRTIVISEKFARKSIQPLAMSLLRDQVVSNNATIVISKQEVSTIMSEALKNPPFYLSDLIKQNMEKGNTPLTNAHSVLNQYYGEGQDVYLPVLDQDENGLIHLDGVGVFKEDKLRLLLTEKESLLLKLLKDKSKTMIGSYEFRRRENEPIYFKILYGKRNISHDQNDSVVISLKLHIQLRELPKTISSVSNSDLLDLKHDIEQHFTSEISDMLKKFQMNAVDPIGFGELYRSNHRNWNEQEYKNKTYPNIKFEVNSEIIISQSGVGVGAE
ncbi:Ger(x)C family spore germination protein [Paenibacillus aceris]|uniref:Ger(X)C family germination protein n=1 Tax=Paenibacillus aceris TaxID=869555 RepID=A0ABS4HWS5_9BACL|nr:Ger(x)C family spore germination protein [Paenibacillus aceris]MBP1963000.1 Ger(x)C family germination protein [Paenibacillus aceris]NHW38424.1 Ger(x)C family spore germination protein [Paenibacillus aceris]